MPIRTDNLHFFQSLGEARALPRGFEASLDHEILRVEILSSDLLRIAISRGGRFDANPSASILALPGSEAAVPVEVTQDGREIRLSTDGIRLTATRSPFSLRALRADGSEIFSTALDPVKGVSLAYGELNNRFVVTRNCTLEDAFYGLGEKTGPFNRRGRDYVLWNTDVCNGGATEEFTRDRKADDPRKDHSSTEFDPYYISIPFFQHHPQRRGSAPMAGHFIDNPWRAEFEFNHPGFYRFSFHGGHYCEYIFAGPDMPSILAGYTSLTGRMSPPPLWALGHHQCRWHKYSQPQVLELARAYRDAGIPCDVLWLDIDYMDGYRVFTWDKTRFPDPAALFRELESDGFRVITIIDPGVKYERGNPLFETGRKDRLFCETTLGTPYVGRVWPGQTVFPDFSLPETRAWWGRLNAEHVKSGIAGIWNDMNEPATFDGDLDAMRFGHGAHEHGRYHNEYALLMAMGTVEGLREAQPGLRTFVLSRAGSPGIQRYAANWMGDNMSRWEHLWLSLPMAMGLGVSGQPFVGADIGGFGLNSEGELLARWYQCAAYTPFFRNHNCMSFRDQYPWSFGGAVERLCAEAIRERYRLLPYLYTCFMESAASGAPIQRPLVFQHQNDDTTRDLDDVFLLGENLLVAPVTTKGATARQVYLPSGAWRSWQDGSFREGGRFHLEDTPLSRIPVFARAGAVIPLWSEVPASTRGYSPEEITLRVIVPGCDGEWISELHEDDGLSFSHEQGCFLRTHFRLLRKGDRLQLSSTVEGNGFPEFRRQRFRIELLDGTSNIQDSAQILPNRGEAFSILLIR